MKCDDCGKEKEDARKTICPYDSDVNGIKTECILCDDCDQLRCDEI